MKLELLDIDLFCQASDLEEVTSPKFFESGRFSRHGLFSQQIFGPVKSYCCACNRTTYKGRSNTEKTCPICGVDITSNEERRKRFARISLPFAVMNPIFYYIICSVKTSMKTILNDLFAFKYYIIINDNGSIEKYENYHDIPEEDRYAALIGLEGAIHLIDKIIDEDDRQEYQYLRDNYQKITMEDVLVIPPDFRPCGNNNSGAIIADEINSHYSMLIMRTNQIKAVPFTITDDSELYKTNFKHIQTMILKLYDYILERMSRKKGLIRSSILGKRMDFSGRAVISPDPTLKIDQCRVPYWMILEVLKPQLAAHLVNRRVCKKYNQSVKLIEDCIKSRDTSLFDITSEFCEGQMCILNRQPTLHRLGVLGFKVTIHLENTIQIHPMVCHPYNADFDGDAIAIYFPITDRSKNDIKNKIGIWNNLISQTDTTIVPRPNQDIILGIYTATNDNNTNDDNIRELTWKAKDENGNHPKLPLGKYLFNKCLPEDYPIITKVLNKNKIINVLNDLALKYPPYTVIETLDRIKNLGFTISTLKGYSLGIDDLYNPELIDVANGLEGDISKDMKTMSSTEVMSILKTSNYAEFIESGARGSWDQMKQLVLSRGYVSDSKGIIRPNLVRNNLVNGLNQTEFFDSCWGARKGLLDTALSTGDSGYLTRQLIYSTVNIELSKEVDDCGATSGLKLYIEDENFAKTLLWRYYIDKDNNNELIHITTHNYKSLIGKTIEVRSPIYCKSKKICKTCYGDLHKILHSEHIGIIAVQTVGERSLQLVLRTFHTGGVAQVGSSSDTDQDDIISGIKIASKLFHKPHELNKLDGSGKISTPTDLVKTIYDIFSSYGGIHLIHYEIICAAMMYSYNDVLWRLDPKRNEDSFKWVSILQLPAKNSWLLGAAFSNLKQKLLEGLIYNKSDEDTPLSRLFKL